MLKVKECEETMYQIYYGVSSGGGRLKSIIIPQLKSEYETQEGLLEHLKELYPNSEIEGEYGSVRITSIYRDGMEEIASFEDIHHWKRDRLKLWKKVIRVNVVNGEGKSVQLVKQEFKDASNYIKVIQCKVRERFVSLDDQIEYSNDDYLGLASFPDKQDFIDWFDYEFQSYDIEHSDGKIIATSNPIEPTHKVSPEQRQQWLAGEIVLPQIQVILKVVLVTQKPFVQEN